MLSQIKTFLSQGWPGVVGEELKAYAKLKTELSLQDGCIFWGARVIVPSPGCAKIVEKLHETHPGALQIKSLARSYVWWLGLDQDLENNLKACTQCKTNRNLPPPAPLHPWEWTDRPWS